MNGPLSVAVKIFINQMNWKIRPANSAEVSTANLSVFDRISSIVVLWIIQVSRQTSVHMEPRL